MAEKNKNDSNLNDKTFFLKLINAISVTSLPSPDVEQTSFYEDEIYITSTSISYKKVSYEIDPLSKKVKPLRYEWSYKTSSSQFNELFEDIVCESVVAINEESKFIMNCETYKIVLLKGKDVIQEKQFCIRFIDNNHDKLKDLILKMIPRQEEIPLFLLGKEKLIASDSKPVTPKNKIKEIVKETKQKDKVSRKVVKKKDKEEKKTSKVKTKVEKKVTKVKK